MNEFVAKGVDSAPELRVKEGEDIRLSILGDLRTDVEDQVGAVVIRLIIL